MTTVNRVVAQLEGAGAIITREIGSDGRQAVFRVVDVTGPKAARPYLHLGDQVRVVAARLSGDDMLIDVSVDKHIYRGVVRGVVTNVNLGGYATVQGIELVDDTLSNVRFEAHGATSGDRMVVLESVRNVTDGIRGRPVRLTGAGVSTLSNPEAFVRQNCRSAKLGRVVQVDRAH